MNKNTWILIGVLVALLVVVYLVMQRPGETSTTGSLEKMLVDYDSAAVDRIDVRTPQATIVLEKISAAWMLTSPLRYRADEATIASALSSGRKIELKGMVSSNPQKQHVFQVDSSGTQVRIYEHGAEKVAFWLGKPSPSYTESYVRREGSDEVYLGGGVFSSLFARPANEWRDKVIIKADQETITAVTLRFGDTTVVLTKQDSLWMVADRRGNLPSSAAAPANDATVKSFVSALATFQTDEFVDSTVSVMPKLTLQIEVNGIQLRLFRQTNADRYYVQCSTSPQLFQVNGWRASQIIKRKKDLLAAAA